MEDNNNSNQTQPGEKQTTIEETKAEAEKLLGQIKQVVENCQNQENSLNEKIQGLSSKTGTLTQEQGKIEDLLKNIVQAERDIASHKKTTADTAKATQEKQSVVNKIAEEIEKVNKVANTHNKSVQDLKTSIEQIEQNSTQSQSSINANEKAIVQSKTVIDSNEKAILQSKATVDQLEAELKAIADTADKKTQAVEEYAAKLEGLNNTWAKKFTGTLTEKDDSLSELENAYSQRYKELEEKIESLLPGATSAGLSSAFMERKKDIENQKNFWRNMTIVGAAGLVVFGIVAIIFPPKITNGLYEFLLYILTRSSILVGIVMIEEFGRRHFNIISRLAETYAYKEVLSRSFEGYKKQMEAVELEPTITTTEIDSAGKESKKIVPMKASSKLSDNLLDNLGIDPANIYEKEKPVPAPVVDVPELAAQSVNKAVEHLGKNRFDIGWRVFGIAIAVIIAIATTIILLVK